MTEPTRPRLAPREAPFEPAVGALLSRMMPAGVPPIALFRTFAHHPVLGEAMVPWGSYLLSKRLSLPMRDREILIDRTTARCGCSYEWGVHVAFFGDRVGLTPAQVAATAAPGAFPPESFDADGVAFTGHEALLVRLVDELHDSAHVSDELWDALAAHYEPAQLLDALFLVGWYHAISFVANATGVAGEAGAPVLPDVTDEAPTGAVALDHRTDR